MKKIESDQNLEIWNNVWKNHWYSKHKLRARRARAKIQKISTILKGFDGIKNVAEIGCGSGEFLFEAQNQLSEGKRYYAIDSSKEAIKLARKNLAANDNVTFINCDISAVDVPDNHFDLIFLIGVLEHAPKKDNALLEIDRILSDNGVIVCFYTNSKSFYTIERKIKSIFFRWDFGYQKEESLNSVAHMFSNRYTVITKGDMHGDIDRPLLTFLDKLFSLLFNNFTRYVFCISRKQ